MSNKTPRLTPHEEAVEIIERLVVQNLGGSLEATAVCNQCSDELTLNLVTGAFSVGRERLVGTVRPDISLLDENGDPVRFIEVVDSHAPEENVHEYALQHHIEVVEIHLRAEREFTGTRRNKALDVSLTVKVRLQELAAGQLLIDAHNLLCHRPKCRECGSPLPLRTITVSTKDCWKCGQNVIVATGDKDGESLEQDYFTADEVAFARVNGVTLERRFSATVQAKYLANVCTHCDQIQGNWYLYMDQFHDRFKLLKTKRQEYGPCDSCATRICMTHGEYLDYRGDNPCPSCLEESERVMCPNNPERECFYPNRCEEHGCYFVNREQEMRNQLQQAEQQRREHLDCQEQQRLEELREWDSFRKWFNERSAASERD